MRVVVALAVVSAFLAAVPAAWAEGDLERGKKFFKYNCYTCHVKNHPYKTNTGSMDATLVLERGSGDPAILRVQNVWGPDLRGVVGAPAGRRSVEGYRHSAPFLKAAPDIVWTEENLRRWMTDSNAMIPGTWMRFKVKKKEDRDDVIAFLKQYE